MNAMPDVTTLDRRNVIPFPEPLRIAENYLKLKCTQSGRVTLRRYAGSWWRYLDGAYTIEPDDTLTAGLYQHLDKVWHHSTKKTDAAGDPEIIKLKATVKEVSEVSHALPACEGVNVTGAMPQWITTKAGYPTHTGFVHCANGLLDPDTMVLHKPTPDYFSTRGVSVPYDPSGATPMKWTAFLSDLFTHEENIDGNIEHVTDYQSIALLQEWFGYILTADTRQQKMLLLIGPKRSGKGTIARIQNALIGEGTVTGPTLGGLATNFGCSSLIGKSLAIISDARLSGRTDQAVVIERLLSISGEDIQTIDRKHRDPVTTQLPTRFMLLTNELPQLADSSGALASRFLVLSLTKSYYGKENHGLTGELKAELPSIFLWALQGLQRLRERGHFEQPERSQSVIDELGELTSPMGAFVRDYCLVGPDRRVRCLHLYQIWLDWCKAQGREKPGTIQTLGRNLRSVITNIKVTQARDDENRERYYEGVGIR